MNNKKHHPPTLGGSISVYQYWCKFPFLLPTSLACAISKPPFAQHTRPRFAPTKQAPSVSSREIWVLRDNNPHPSNLLSMIQALPLGRKLQRFGQPWSNEIKDPMGTDLIQAPTLATKAMPALEKMGSPCPVISVQNRYAHHPGSIHH